MSGDKLATAPRSLGEQLTTALTQLRGARSQGEPERELVWQTWLDKLLDRYSAGFR